MDATLDTTRDRPVLRFERHLPHPPEKVWRAVTEPGHLARWFPAAPTLPATPAVGERIEFTFPDQDIDGGSGEITHLDPPRLFAFTWNGEHLRFDLHPEPGGCLLVFTHAFGDLPGAASFAAGWHVCLDALTTTLDGGEPGEPTPWAPLHDHYAEQFGLLHGEVTRTDLGWQVRFEQQLTRPVDQVWADLTGGDTPVGAPAPAGLTTATVPGGTVTAADPPTLLEYLADGDRGLVRCDLTPGPGGARLVLTHASPERPSVEELATWHELVGALTGLPPATRSDLRARYAATTP